MDIAYRQYQRVMSNALWKGVLVIGGGTALAQVISIISIPIITRLYDPSDFGLLGIYISVLTVLTVFTSLRYDYAIPIPELSSKAANIFALCVAILIGVSGVLSITLFLLGDTIADLLDMQDLMPYTWLIVIGFLGSGIYQVLNYWAIRQRDYSRITRTKVSQSIGGATSKILLGLLSLGPLGLILGYIISSIAGIYTFTKAIAETDRDAFRGLSVAGIKSAAHEYRSFPIYSVPASLLVAIASQIPVFVLSSMYGLSVVGWYTLAYQMLSLPVGLIAGSMAQVFYGEAAKDVREDPGRLRHLYLDTTKKLAQIALPMIGIPALLAPWLFPIVFGESWGQAGLYCLPLALVAVSQFIVMPTSRLAIYGFNYCDFYFNISRIILIIGGFLFVDMLDLNPVIALTVYGIITAFMYGILYKLNIYAIDNLKERTNGRPITPP